jgi:2-dehydropantoate 2-reductase
MRILMLGAGAVGGYFGARLAASGADVTFLVREARAAQLADRGLVVLDPAGDLTVPAPRTLVSGQPEPAGATPFDCILLTCKAYGLDGAISAITPHVGAGTVILPLLNGMAHLDRLDRRFGAERVLGGLCQVAATLTPDGEIRHLNDIQRIIFGERDGTHSPRVTALAGIMGRAPFQSRASDDILLEMWEKWVMLATLAGMTCLMRGSVGDIVAASDGSMLMEQLLTECAAVAGAAGHAPRPKVLDQSRAMLTTPGSTFTASMLRDIERGGPTEGEHILGDLVARAAAFGVAAPLLRVAFCHLQVYERRRAAG